MPWQINSMKGINSIIPGSLCYLVHDGKVLLLQRRRPPHVGLWTPPGGKMQPGESPQDCIRREFGEETGLTPVQLQLRAVTTVLHAGLAVHWLLFIYHAAGFQGELTASEEGELKWIGLDELARYPRPPADVRMLNHVLSADPVCEMLFSYDMAEQLVEPLLNAE